MAKWTVAKRKALDKKWFGEPDSLLFPVQDQEDLDAAAHLIGKAKDPDAVKRRLRHIAQELGLTLPDAWKTATLSLPDAFALEGETTDAEHDGMVRRTALITKAVELPSHSWVLTPDELRAAAERFTGPGYVELQHFTSERRHSILDGQMGHLEGVWASDDGQELYGDLLLPEWLNTIADKHGGKVSAVFDKEAKDIVGVGLVLEPAVPEAAMLSAYVAFAKRHDTPSGQYAVQDLHDTAVRHGATCAAGNVGMASKHEAGAIQSIHDMAVSHGATCEAMGARGSGSGGGGMSVAMSRNEENSAPVRATEQGENTMPETTEATTPTPTTLAAPKAQPDGGPTNAELKAQLDAERTQREAQQRALVALQAERRVEKAELWADKQIIAGQMVAAERPLWVKLHVMASTDDETTGLVTLADGATESRLATLLAAIAIRPAVGLVGEKLPGSTKVAVLLNRQQTQDAKAEDEDDNEKLLEMTEGGRRALQMKRAAAVGR